MLILLFSNLGFHYECDSIFMGFLLVVDLCLLAWLNNFIKGFGLMVIREIGVWRYVS